MEASEAREIIATHGQYKSADFYRMLESTKIALAVFDDASLILNDVIVHGSEEAQAILAQFLAENIVVIDDTQNPPHVYFNNSWDNTVQSQMAMQIAYPEVYRQYFDGSNIWDPTHEQFQALLNLCVVAMAGTRKYASDFYGDHLNLREDEPTPQPLIEEGPLISENMARSTPDQWAIARANYSATVSSLWAEYIQACEDRRYRERELKEIRDAKMEEARAMLQEAREEYGSAIKALSDHCQDLRRRHSEFKHNQKPKKEQE